MRILLDECLPKKLKRELVGHTVFTVQEKRWNGLKNGQLLRRAAREFDVWVTADQSIEYQQNLDHFNIAVVVLIAQRNELETLLPLMEQLQKVLQIIQPHQIVYIDQQLNIRYKR